MTIPDYQSIMLPFLEYIQDGKPHSLKLTTDALAIAFELTQDEIEDLLPSGSQRRFYNRVGWARTYMKKAGLLVAPEKGYVAITPRGEDVLERTTSLTFSVRKFHILISASGIHRREPRIRSRRRPGSYPCSSRQMDWRTRALRRKPRPSLVTKAMYRWASEFSFAIIFR